MRLLIIVFPGHIHIIQEMHADKIYPWNKLRQYMGVTRNCLSFSFYEQLKLHFLTY